MPYLIDISSLSRTQLNCKLSVEPGGIVWHILAVLGAYIWLWIQRDKCQLQIDETEISIYLPKAILFHFSYPNVHVYIFRRSLHAQDHLYGTCKVSFKKYLAV